MLNREIYAQPPEQTHLLNQGVAAVSEDHSDAAKKVLRYELKSFVCSGQYEKGLQEILEKFLLNLSSRTEQPGVWISGFFGSGKSHLAKMLRALWTDYSFDDGATARGLAKLPTSVSDALKELSTQSKREGGLHAAAGKLGEGANDNIRLAVLGIVFKSAGLPEAYHQADFVMWLRREGLYDAVTAELHNAGRSLAQELPHMFVSDHLARALRKARPSFADSEMAARQFIKAQFPQVTDVTNAKMVEAIVGALSKEDKFPLTLIVLDEVQQFVGNDGQKAYQVQEVTETLSKHFKGLLLFVGTGQSALSGMPNLQRLLGRFPVSVTLGDWDVENVTRQIILGKKSSAKPAIEQTWRSNLGEISRHLRGTKLEHVTSDEAILTADYPILPVRRRFWERVLRSIDTTGTVSQLRSQLRVVHEAVLATANLPLGHVVAADFLYDQIAANLVSTAQLSKEVFENVQRFAVSDAKSQLKAKLLKLIYLINKLPAKTANEIGLRATDEVLADLLVVDLGAGSAELRNALPALLDELQSQDRLIMALQGGEGTEYRLQTRESSTWHDEFRSLETALKAAPKEIDVERADLIKARFREILAKVRVVQGKESVSRPLTPSFDQSLPKDNAKALYLWIQDGWQNDEKSVLAEARAKGADNPTLFAFLPAQNRTDIANAIVALKAAEATLTSRGIPTTEEGREAMRSMETRKVNAQTVLTALLDKLFAEVKLFQAGGQPVPDGASLADRIKAAAQTAAIRLYPEFDTADHDKWDKVLEEARKGSLDALKVIGHAQEAEKHPVLQKVLAFIGASKKGIDVREHFDAPPYGWSRDAIDGALYALVATGHLRVTDASGKVVDAKGLDRAKLTQATFQRESITITPPQKIRIRTLFSTALGVPCPPGEELTKAQLALSKLRSLATAAGGEAPAPEAPSVSPILALEAQSGTGLLYEFYSRADELTQLAQSWANTAAAIQQRLPIWHQLQALLRHAKGLNEYAGIAAEVEAISEQRSLLAEPDPIRPLLESTTELLRKALNLKLQAYAAEFERHLLALESDSEWLQLTDAQRNQLISQHQLTPIQAPDLASAVQLQEALDGCNLQHWGDRTGAIGSRFDAARREAARLLKPDVLYVLLPKRTLSSDQELKIWLAEVEALLSEKLKKGPVAL